MIILALIVVLLLAIFAEDLSVAGERYWHGLETERQNVLSALLFVLGCVLIFWGISG